MQSVNYVSENSEGKHYVGEQTLRNKETVTRVSYYEATFTFLTNKKFVIFKFVKDNK